MSIFDDLQHRDDPDAPVALSPEAAKGGPDGDGGPGVDISFWLDLGASLGSLAQTLRADHDRRGVRCPPGNAQLFASGTFPASGVLTLDLGSVPLGRVWQVRRLIVGGVAANGPAQGAAYAFAQGAPPSDLNLTNCVDIFTSLPRGNTYGTHQLFLVATEHLWVVVALGTAGQNYAASVRIEDWDDGAFTSTFSE